MRAGPSITNQSRTSPARFRSPRNAKHLDINSAKVALDIIIRPSVQLCKLALGRNIISSLKRPNKTVVGEDALASPASSKRVRFDEKPVTISRRRFFERRKKDSPSPPPRPCLVVRDHVAASNKRSAPSAEPDAVSIYEDCLSFHPDFVVDIHVLEGDEHLHTRPLKNIRRSEFYEMESGIAMFDRAGYANYCLSRWLDKQREESRSPKCVFEDPALLPWPSRTLPLPPPWDTQPEIPRPVRPVPIPVSQPSRPLFWRVCRYIEDEFQNAVVVLFIGLFIHLCLFLYLVYDVLTRGLVPSDD